MQVDLLRKIAWCVAGLAWLSYLSGSQAAPLSLVVSVPGPGNISYLPIVLIHKIGADRAENADVRLIYATGGAIALEELLGRNSDFAVAGLPAVLSQRQHQRKVVALAAVNDLPLFILMVRSDLNRKVKTIRDLKGRVIGVNTSTLGSKTTSQQLLEIMLKSNGVGTNDVRIIAAGQSWDTQSSLMLSKQADALMGDEPFASRLQSSGQVFALANLADGRTTKNIPGASFLHATLNTHADVISQTPEKVATMVAILQRTLRWMATNPPEKIVETLQISDASEKAALLAALKQYPRLYSRDGRFSDAQLQQTAQFFSASSGDLTASERLLRETVDDRWAGRKD